MPSEMTIELVRSVRGQEWWVKVNGTRVVRLDLSPDSPPSVVRAVAEQALVKLARSAIVQC